MAGRVWTVMAEAAREASLEIVKERSDRVHLQWLIVGTWW